MSLAYKVLGQVLFTSTTTPGTPGNGYYGGIGGGGTSGAEILAPVTLYTVPAGKSTVITSIFAVNLDTVSRTYDLAVVPSGESLSLKHHIRWDQPIAAAGVDLVTSKVTLSSGDSLVVLPSTINKVAFTAFGVEQ